MKSGTSWKTGLKDILKNLYWFLYGVTVRNTDLPPNVHSILFVCKGNICRSPFAEYMAKNILKDLEGKTGEQKVSSAGIHANKTEKPPLEAVNIAKKYGVEMPEHESQPINYEMIEAYDMIVVMETCQYKFLRKIFMEFSNKIYLLSLFDSRYATIGSSYFKYNIQDPYGKRPEDYNLCFDRISRCISILYSKIELNPHMSRDIK